jgi:hypothetical protein
MNLEVLFNNVEKLLRYLVPAFVLTILLRYFKGNSFDDFFSKISDVEFVIYFVLAGITVYSIHRVVFEIIDYLLFGCNTKTISEYILSSFKAEKAKDLKDYLYYKLATIHSVLLATELTIVFILSEGCSTHPYLLIISAILFIFSFLAYCFYHNIQREIFGKSP